MDSKFDSFLIGMDNLLKTIKGEVYNFATGHKKTSGKIARKALSELKIICFNFRQEILHTLKAMPVKKKPRKEK